ncbi:MAG: HipA domain-containing protein [bacterium]|nr:HipA domain-containing protein [bacterium]
MLPKTNELIIWIENIRVGALEVNELGQFRLNYESAWVASPTGYPISPTLPLAGSEDSAEIHSAKVRFFFSNLLPEGKSLDEAVLANGLSKSNVFGLLHALGKESAGALMLLPPSQHPETLTSDSDLREITNAELSERIRAMPNVPFSVWDGKVRMSIAGYQAKLAVHKTQDGRLWLASGKSASTHILKPQASALNECQVANEYFCMRLAAMSGIESAEVDILRVPEPILVIKRFDRQLISGVARRLHIIDACQALNKSPEQKYERNFGAGEHVKHIRDGVSIKNLFSITDLATNKADMTLRQLRWLIFQHLIGNSDAHGKNMSFYVARDGLKMAPAYDQLSVTIYPTINHEFAMAIGDEFLEEAIRAYQWADFAIQVGLNPGLVARTIKHVANKANRALPTLLADPILTDVEKNFLNRLANQIQVRVEKFLEIAKILPGVARDIADEDVAVTLTDICK